MSSIDLDEDECYCGREWDDPRGHFIYLVFMELYNEDYNPIFINRCAARVTHNKFIHVQIAMENGVTGLYDTFSVDSTSQCVTVTSSKRFSRDGWTWVQFSVSQEQERIIYQFLSDQKDKPFNWLGLYSVAFWPVAGNRQSYFCSELVMHAFHEIGLFHEYAPEEMFPVDIYDLAMAQTSRAKETHHLVRMKEFMQDPSGLIMTLDDYDDD